MLPAPRAAKYCSTSRCIRQCACAITDGSPAATTTAPFDLTLLPEVTAAAHRHIRLARHREPSALKTGYRQANEIAQDWFDRSSFLTPVWHERYDRIGATHAYGARVITYPETVGLTSLLSSPHWTRMLQRGNYHVAIPAFLHEEGRPDRPPLPRQPPARPPPILGRHPVGRDGRPHPRTGPHRLVTIHVTHAQPEWPG